MEYILGYAIDTKTLLYIGVVLMKTVMFLTALIFVQVIIKRATLVYREKRRQKFLELWRPVLAETVTQTPEKIPVLDENFYLDFICEWNAFYEKIEGPSRNNLIALAHKLNISEYAIELLISSEVKLQLISIMTLGHMHVDGAWPYLFNIAKNSQPVLSIAAYRALTQINMEKALVELMPQLINRHDWPPSMVAKILKDVKTPKVCELLEEATYDATAEELPNIVSYINVLKCSNSTRVFRQLLEKQVDDKIVSLCLHELNDPSAIDLVYRYLDYPRWHVRVNVATALGKIGTKADMKHLIKLLHDPQWWVRYRAAQAIVNMPLVGNESIEKIMKKLDDVKAIQILEQAIAEKEMV